MKLVSVHRPDRILISNESLGARKKRTGLSLQSERPVHVPCRSVREERRGAPVRASMRVFTSKTRLPKSRSYAGRESQLFLARARELLASVAALAVDDGRR
jgi:hypothetical protein